MSTSPPPRHPDDGFAPPWSVGRESSPSYQSAASVFETPPPAYQASPQVYRTQPPAYQVPPSIYLNTLPGDQSPPLGQRRTPAVWIAVTIAFAALVSLVLPAVSDAMIQSRPVAPGEEFGLLTGSIAAPAGWNVSVPGAALGSPTLTQGDVEVMVFTGFWQGDTEDLLERVLEWMVDPRVPATTPALQGALASDGREVFRVDMDRADGPGVLMIIREEAAVAVVVVTSTETWSSAVERDIVAIADSVWLDAVPLMYVEEAP
ncbi:MAG: hypothetical protein CVT64_00225 [Actinobacteria bacterium HGW-Actinobacteria-4]|nr:MAG: hypothetical protein CVT64_00225 [Actinobacteria bacterium HGW-Actinobacteria-4]